MAEDFEPLRRFLVRALGLLGFDATGFATASDLERAVANSSPDAVILDWHLDDRPGQQTLDAMSQQGPPVVVVTGDPTGVGEIGVPVLCKPLNMDELQATLGRVIS